MPRIYYPIHIDITSLLCPENVALKQNFGMNCNQFIAIILWQL